MYALINSIDRIDNSNNFNVTYNNCLVEMVSDRDLNTYLQSYYNNTQVYIRTSIIQAVVNTFNKLTINYYGDGRYDFDISYRYKGDNTRIEYI